MAAWAGAKGHVRTGTLIPHVACGGGTSDLLLFSSPRSTLSECPEWHLPEKLISSERVRCSGFSGLARQLLRMAFMTLSRPPANASQWRYARRCAIGKRTNGIGSKRWLPTPRLNANNFSSSGARLITVCLAAARRECPKSNALRSTTDSRGARGRTQRRVANSDVRRQLRGILRGTPPAQG
jgi:hypothetical protein